MKADAETLTRYLGGYLAQSQQLKIACYFKRKDAWMVGLGDGTYVGLRVRPYEPAVGVYRITAQHVQDWFTPLAHLSREVKGWPKKEVRNNLADRQHLEVSFSCENADKVFKWFVANLKEIKTVPSWIETRFLEVGQPLNHYTWEAEASERVTKYQATEKGKPGFSYRKKSSKVQICS
jgi:hypothetical protein